MTLPATTNHQKLHIHLLPLAAISESAQSAVDFREPFAISLTMADPEITSVSGSDHAEAGQEEAAASGVEVTSASEPEPPKKAPKCRGRGHGRQRGVGSSRGLPAQVPANKSRGRGRARGRQGTTWLHRPKSKQDVDVEKTSASEETTRIQTAAKHAKTWLSMEEHTSSSNDEMQVDAATDMGSASMPNTSGVFNYAMWLVGKLSSQQRDKLQIGFHFMDLCAGLGTTLLAHEALKSAMRHYGLRTDGACTGLTELAEGKREALRRRCARLKINTPIFKSNASLTLQTPEDAEGNLVDVPLADLLFMGIVCVDISRCSSTPKSLTDPDGASGKSWNDLLAYLDRLPLDQRPKAIILECVDNLGNNRAIQGHTEKGTLIVIEALRERGYVGQWTRALASRFAVPQSRPRVWALFLKVQGGVGPKAIAGRERHIQQAFDVIRQGETLGFEPLQRILARCPNSTPAQRAERQSLPRGDGWHKEQHPNFRAKHGLSEEDITMGQHDFLEATNGIILPREQAAVWLTLCVQRKKGRIPNWKEDLLVSDCGSSVGWLSISSGKFPCLRPGNKYLVLQHGVAKIAHGPLCLAVQGIGPEEQHALDLHLEEDSLLRQLAGNAFCANICVAFLIAAILVA